VESQTASSGSNEAQFPANWEVKSLTEENTDALHSVGRSTFETAAIGTVEEISAFKLQDRKSVV
jgi:hypothetical protein